ncbi:Cof-type HAD-IIB family hydrolase [Listeria seeligeri]|uniref:Cof-type HAD-IIB family hydrolase n=1 Tax=Listeria seeligeri TaxID=1640 RepID=UPI0016268255|nr:Cof-type HAD-IIB family hydrolase [Listeria seeligeri]MBC1744374.1 Cof-type HAD-IIB family hydrolase [Listeria seeligeri]MBC1756572.1 Cof-type HAD-IIB family hydrolase [Listeria seeligeri]MBC1816455.1 Cof-type HAD-IIB family hydrolase [Listeria seeligeri]MBC2030729.1 Cof-type HAD-IIB family hydrolase [Listeria seeligeri]MBC6115212.1 Cof-type HAD-IIB family hydrolase [Listeria seeligeri]
MKPRGICFFDMDGTLLNSESKVLDSSLRALDKLRENNIIPVIATGRTLTEISQQMNITGIESAVMMNGQMVVFEGEKVYEDVLEEELLERLTQEAKSQNVEICYYNDKRIGASAINPVVKAHYDFLGEPTPMIRENMYKEETINMALLLLESGDEYFPERFKELQFVRNTPFSNDVLRKGGSKAVGIAKLLEVMGYQDVPTYAFGDGMNDLEMFGAVNYSVAMENAVPLLKEQATFITKDNNNDGIKLGLEKFGLI